MNWSGVRVPPDPFPPREVSLLGTTMTLDQKFETSTNILRDAVTGDICLDTQYPIIFQKVYRHYEDMGVDFYGDTEEQYAILIHKLETDLFY